MAEIFAKMLEDEVDQVWSSEVTNFEKAAEMLDL